MIETPHLNRSIFIDSSKLEEITKWDRTGIVDGVTTNQAIMYKDGVKPGDFIRVVRNICDQMAGRPVSIELASSTASLEEMVEEAKRLNKIAENIVIKVPLIPGTTKSLEVVNLLAQENIAVNITALMTFEQMIMAAAAARKCSRPSFISLFWARSKEEYKRYLLPAEDANIKKAELAEKDVDLEVEKSEVNKHPRNIVRESVKFLNEAGYHNPRIIVGSIRNATMVGEAFASGAHIVTITPQVLEKMLYAQRTIETNKEFDEAWQKLQAGT